MKAATELISTWFLYSIDMYSMYLYVMHAINIVELHFADKLGHVLKEDKSKSKTILHLCAIIVPADFRFIFN